MAEMMNECNVALLWWEVQALTEYGQMPKYFFIWLTFSLIVYS